MGWERGEEGRFALRADSKTWGIEVLCSLRSSRPECVMFFVILVTFSLGGWRREGMPEVGEDGTVGGGVEIGSVRSREVSISALRVLCV